MSAFFVDETATTMRYTYLPHLSLHDALPCDGAGDTRGQGSGLVGAQQSRDRPGRGADADRPVAAAAIGTTACRAGAIHARRAVRSPDRKSTRLNSSH